MIIDDLITVKLLIFPEKKNQMIRKKGGVYVLGRERARGLANREKMPRKLREFFIPQHSCVYCNF